MLAAANDLPPLTLTEAWKAHARSMRAAGRSPHTLKGRKTAVEQLAALCEEHGVTPVVGIHLRAVVEAYLAHLLETQKPTVEETRFDQLHAFFGWLVHEEELSERKNPLRLMERPAAPILPVKLIPDEDLVRLLRACKGKSFAELRDTAIIRVLIDTGMRVGGLVSMQARTESLDLDRQKAEIRLKAGRIITVPLGAKTTEALGRYLRVRVGRRVARAETALWITDKGPLTESGVAQMLTRRARQAGLAHIHPHLFRHTLAQWWMDKHASEEDLMEITGWTSRKVLERYTLNGRAERAHDMHRRIGPGDRV